MGFRYIGSKNKLSDLIIQEIKLINPSATRVIDLMAGTGLFSKALRENGFAVTAVDVMTYSYHHLNVHLFVNDPGALFKGVNSLNLKNDDSLSALFEIDNYDRILEHLNNLAPMKGYFYNEFSPEGCPANSDQPRKYFTAENASKIDAIREEIRSLYDNRVVNDIEFSILVHDLIMAVNDIANIAGTYGHYLSKFVKRALDPIVLTRTLFDANENIAGHKVYKGYAEELAKELEGDICYIDPPYIKRQYAANYHVLETIARGDEPEAIGISGLRPWRDQYSNFCSKVKIRDSFSKILLNLQCRDILVSYSDEGLLGIEELVEFFNKFGDVVLKEFDYKRFKSHQCNQREILTEYLIHLRKH